jgi:hypothetical protein
MSELKKPLHEGCCPDYKAACWRVRSNEQSGGGEYSKATSDKNCFMKEGLFGALMSARKLVAGLLQGAT